MPRSSNFLLGNGERLTESIPPPGSVVEKLTPYNFEEAKTRLTPRLQKVARALSQMPSLACPDDRVVAALTLHPTYVAKSYYPGELLKTLGVEAVGSHYREITPDKWTKEGVPQPSPSTEIYIAGPRSRFQEIASSISGWQANTPGSKDIVKIEDIRSVSSEEKIKSFRTQTGQVELEIVLHASATHSSDYIIRGFFQYLKSLGIEVDSERRLYTNSLCFLPISAPRDKVEQVAEYAFLRAVREMPGVRPLPRTYAGQGFSCSLPDADALNPAITAAIFDGGLPANHGLERWVTYYPDPELRPAHGDGANHGMAVTSALLFGPLSSRATPLVPNCHVDHYQVLGDPADGCTSFDAIYKIRDHLLSSNYNFINLSLGPDLPIEDDEVSSWTAIVDELTASGNILATVAIGNGGDADHESGNARIQPPGDSVNGLCVGSADSLHNPAWQRAQYSCIGPGRSPGVIKPDVLAFGGSHEELFWVLDADRIGYSTGGLGTSFAAPNVLRMATGIKSTFGDSLSPLAIKALLIHSSELESTHISREVGWGKVPNQIDPIVMCDDDTVRVVFQGRLSPAEWIRAQIPIPSEQLIGKVSIKATLCYTTPVDPQDPTTYTRSGLEVVFRPNSEKRSQNPDKANADSKPFFQRATFNAAGDVVRYDAHKWETTLNAQHNFLGRSLSGPTFDIHYNARESGRGATSAEEIPYALVITVRAPRVADLYNRVVTRYLSILQPIRPVIEIPIGITSPQ